MLTDGKEKSSLKSLACDHPPGGYLQERNLVHDFDPKPFHRHNLAGVVRQQPDRVQSEIGQDLRADAALVLRLARPGPAIVRNEPARARRPGMQLESQAGLVE